MKIRKPLPTAATVKVIRDVRDGRQDIQVPVGRARMLYHNGLLDWDETNKAYCTNQYSPSNLREETK